MVDNDIPKYAALLKGHYLFKGLNEAQIAHTVTRFERIEFDADEVVFEEGSFGDGFFLIFQGRLNAVRRDENGDVLVDILGPGDYFGEEALLFDHPRRETITTIEHVILLRLRREDFYELIQNFPQIKRNLSATAESRYLAQKADFDWVGDDEVVYLITRKHEFFLILSLIFPILVGLISIPVLLLGFSTESSAGSPAAITFGVVGILFSIFWTIWKWKDWGNDYYIVTNQRVVWLERVLIFYFSRREAPLTQILSVNVTRSWLGRILDYGNVEVKTFTGGIRMRNSAHPKQLAYFIEGFQTRAQNILRQVEAEKMERALRQRLGMYPRDEYLEEPHDEPEQKPPDDLVKKEGWREVLGTFLQVRYERDGVITYRKHWLLLVRKTLFPSITIALLIVFTLYLLGTGALWGESFFSGLPALTLAGLLYFAAISWWVYNYVDWSNDIYQLTHDKIFDIERKPLGEEEKKTAPLDSILSLEHTRLGILQLALNYGNVTIMVGQTPFIFRGVYNPDDVQQDISSYIEARRRKKEESEAERDRQRMADWLVTYHQQSEILDGLENRSDWDLFPG